MYLWKRKEFHGFYVVFPMHFHSFVTNPLWCGLVFPSLSLHSWRKSDLCWLPGQQTTIVSTSTCAYWMAHLSFRQKTCVLRWCGRLASRWRKCLIDILNNVKLSKYYWDLFSINCLISGWRWVDKLLERSNSYFQSTEFWFVYSCSCFVFIVKSTNLLCYVCTGIFPHY